jgi:hypothetical protein
MENSETSEFAQRAYPVQQEPLTDNSLHYGDYVYLHIENIGGYIQSSG